MSKKTICITIIAIMVATIISACGSGKSVEVSSDLLEQLKTSYASGLLDVDYDSAEAFESALNNGEDVLLKTVTFIPYRIEPDSGVGFNMISGEHLNFASEGSVDVSENDTVTVVVKGTDTLVGSWILKYELIGIEKTSEKTAEEPAEIEITGTDVSEAVSKAIESNGSENKLEDEPQNEKEEVTESVEPQTTVEELTESVEPQTTTEEVVEATDLNTAVDGGATVEEQPTQTETVDAVETPKVEESAPVSVKVSGQDRNVSLAPGTMVWKSQTGSKFHTHNDCGNMNPDKAQQITVEQAVQLGLEACDKCY